MNIIEKRLIYYFLEATKHVQKISRAKEVLSTSMPLDFKAFEELNEVKQDKLDIMAFRFAKLQDLLGDKIFKLILEYSGFNAQKPFIEILSELEKENLLDVNIWIELRNSRNKISHEYPDDMGNLVEAINFIYDNLDYLIDLTQELEEYFYAIKKRRDK